MDKKPMLSLKLQISRLMTRFPKRIRIAVALCSAALIILTLLFYLSSVSPQYLFTIGDSLTILTPKGFTLELLQNFESYNRDNQTIKTTEKLKELVLPRPDKKMISFKYPEVVTLGRPSYLSNDISQNVTFIIKDPPANGLIQIWLLSTSIDDFLESSKHHSNLEYITFKSEKSDKDGLAYYVWDYTYEIENKIVRGLEAFFDDKPYMYRISIFADSSQNEETIKSIFDKMINSVTVK